MLWKQIYNWFKENRLAFMSPGPEAGGESVSESPEDKLESAKQAASEKAHEGEEKLSEDVKRRREIDMKLMPLLGRELKKGKGPRKFVKMASIGSEQEANFDEYVSAWKEHFKGKKRSYNEVTNFHEQFLGQLESKKMSESIRSSSAELPKEYSYVTDRLSNYPELANQLMPAFMDASTKYTEAMNALADATGDAVGKAEVDRNDAVMRLGELKNEAEKLMAEQDQKAVNERPPSYANVAESTFFKGAEHQIPEVEQQSDLEEFGQSEEVETVDEEREKAVDLLVRMEDYETGNPAALDQMARLVPNELKDSFEKYKKMADGPDLVEAGKQFRGAVEDFISQRDHQASRELFS